MELAFFKLNRWIASFAALVIVIFLLGGCVPANHPPCITSLKAKEDVVFPLESCLIECVASDEDGDELSYEWSARDGDIGEDGAAVNWSAPESEGIYNIMVKVSDGNGGEATGSVTIEVKDNHPPTISLIADADWVTPSGSCRIECYAEDPDDDELSYQWSASGGNISDTGSIVTWTAPEAEGLYTITVVVTDGYGGEATRPLDVSVSLNSPPVIESLIVTPIEHKYLREEDPDEYEVGEEKSCSIECIVSDASGELVYEWSCDGGEISGEGSVITWTAPDVKGAVTVVTVTVSDAYGNMASKSIDFTVVSCSACTFG